MFFFVAEWFRIRCRSGSRGKKLEQSSGKQPDERFDEADDKFAEQNESPNKA